MKLKVSDFKGVYTNADGNDLALEYLKDAVDCKFREGYVESEGFQLNTVTVITPPAIPQNAKLLWYGKIYLDNDFLSETYTQEIKEYTLFIYNYYKENINVIEFFIQKDDGRILESFPISNSDIKVIKVIYSRRKTKVITTESIFNLQTINRTLRVSNTNPIKIDTITITKEEIVKFSLNSKTITSGTVAGSKLKYTKQPVSPIYPNTPISQDNYREWHGGMWIGYYKVTDEDNEVVKYPDNLYEKVVFQALLRPFPLGTHIFFSTKTYPNATHYYIPVGYFDGYTYDGLSFTDTELDLYYDGNWIEYPFYKFDRANFSRIVNNQANISYTKVNLATEGLTPSKISTNKINVVTTYVLNNTEEYVASLDSIDISKIGAEQPFTIEFFLQNLYFLNQLKTITRVCLYKQYKKDEKYEQFAVINLIDSDKPGDSKVYLTNLSPNGVYLNQTIGMDYTPETYKPIFDYTDFLYVGKVPYVLYGSNVYSPAIGNGQIMEIFYSQNFIPDATNRRIIKLTNINNDLGVHTDKDLIVINQQNDEQGGILFFVRNVLGLPIVNEYQVSEAPDGIVVLTKFGIYVTNGSQREMISKPINDLIEKYYSTAIIAYSAMEEELYLVINNQLWVFFFVTQTWSRKNSDVRGTTRIEVDYDKVYFYFTNGSKVLSRVYANIYAKLQSHSTDINEPNLLKKLNENRYDYIGTLKRNNSFYAQEDRTLIIFKENIKNRKPKTKIDYSIEFSGKLYGIEMDVEPVTEVRKKVFVAIPDPGIIDPLPPIKDPVIGVVSNE